jgi:hypothetical protein
MLTYLAARSVARRFAFTCNARDLGIMMIFRGNIEEAFRADEIEEELNSIIESNRNTEVWIALLNDSVVMMSESTGGATLVLSHLINDRIEIESRTPRDYAQTRELMLSVNGRDDMHKRFKITSPFPAALVVFERKFAAQKVLLAKEQAAAEPLQKVQQVKGTTNFDMMFGQ